MVSEFVINFYPKHDPETSFGRALLPEVLLGATTSSLSATTSSLSAMLLRALLLAALSPAAALRAAASTLSRPGPRRAAAIGQLAASDIGCGSAEWLSRNVESGDLAVVLETLLTSCAQVASKVRTASCDSTACFSPLMEEGDEVAVDVLANELCAAALCSHPLPASSPNARTRAAAAPAGSWPACARRAGWAT